MSASPLPAHTTPAVDPPQVEPPIAKTDVMFSNAVGPFKWHGPLQRTTMRLRLVPEFMEHMNLTRSEAIDQFKLLADSDLLYCVNAVAVAKGLTIPLAIGDGELFKMFLDFITAHWQDILKIILSLFGL